MLDVLDELAILNMTLADVVGVIKEGAARDHPTYAATETWWLQVKNIADPEIQEMVDAERQDAAGLLEVAWKIYNEGYPEGDIHA